MRKILSSAAVLALALGASPVALADSAPPAAGPSVAEAPLATTPEAKLPVEAGGFCPTVDPLGNAAAKPDFVSSGPCYVQRTCDDSSVISCNGASSCNSGPGTGGGYVTCDGATTWCDAPPNNCPDEGTYCKYNGTYCGTCLDGAPCNCYNRQCICL